MADKIRYLSCFVLTYWVLRLIFSSVFIRAGEGLVEGVANRNISGWGDPSLTLQAATPFYGSLLFYDILLIITIISIYLGVWLRSRYLGKVKARLKQNMERQTEVLHHNIIRLEQSERRLLESNRMKDEITAMILHDLRSPIRFVKLMAAYLEKNFDTMPTKQLEQRISALKSSTSALNEFTEQFFTWAASQHQDFKVNKVFFDLKDLFLEIKSLYQDILVINENEIVIEPCYIIALTDRQILSTIIRNIVDNSNKIMKKGRIHISGNVEYGGVNIFVTDNGPGFEKGKLQKFLGNGQLATPGGHGSIILRNLIKIIEGRLEVYSEEGIGTIFKITLPSQG
ncbi:MAG TPA: HAMP domain-containing sensor histidine kinase [Saprospiraceae bacterium]|nr:HAMP domain-containing histidine kinase [Saprospiraceae bacterium]MBX7178266.1 HAMP domain-containing histidine kinase [Saprospiraceae bacterium]MCC7149056.1 HAMP domain-containing histidine kinase [Saprospiraceae bacterium]MCO5284012.1 HAMP domain-containing histidine kinase [Saprospiraceae bacterium]MCO6470874.1 HAMP domain-containing histidine kinase [Saprospiraceae bacterium]